MTVKSFLTRFDNAWITTLNHQSFLVVEDLASSNIHFGKLLTLTPFLITRTSNLCVLNHF